MKDFPISILDTQELYGSSMYITKAAKPALAEDPYATFLCTNIDSGLLGMERAMGRSLNSPFTPLTKQKDEVRDHSFIGLRDYVSSRTHSKNPAIASAAFKLAEIISNIGNYIYRLGYVDQSAKTSALIYQLSTPEATQWLTTISATEDFKAVCDSQKDFEAQVQEKTSTESKINIPLLKESTAKVSKYLVPLLTYIETSTEINPDLFKPLENCINGIITDFVAIARARITRHENEKENTPK